MNSLFANFFLTGFVTSIVFLPSTAADMNTGCPSGSKAFKGNCFMVARNDTDMTQPEAQNMCHAMGAILVSIHTDAEFQFIQGLLHEVSPSNDIGFWIGVKLARRSDTAELISCFNLDGSAFDYGTCSYKAGEKPWAWGEPGNNYHNNELCVFINHKGFLDGDCTANTNVQGYVCKLK